MNAIKFTEITRNCKFDLNIRVSSKMNCIGFKMNYYTIV